MKEEIEEKLKKYGQEHLINFYEEIEESKKSYLESQIKKIDFEQIEELFEETKKEKQYNDKIEPMKYVDKYKLSDEERKHYESIGDAAIQRGEYAVATMAGGQRNKTSDILDQKELLNLQKENRYLKYLAMK